MSNLIKQRKLLFGCFNLRSDSARGKKLMRVGHEMPIAAIKMFIQSSANQRFGNQRVRSIATNEANFLYRFMRERFTCSICFFVRERNLNPKARIFLQ